LGNLKYRQFVNTNLEDISDWLTKIIVGLTLVQFRELTGYFRECAALFAAGLGEGNQSLAFAQGAIVYFSVLGFLCGYLMTQLFLAVALRLADQDELQRIEMKIDQTRSIIGRVNEEVKATKKEVAEVAAQAAQSAAALRAQK
jgi:hypothetical protein